MRVAPGVTLWGPALLPERAELLSGPVERLIGLLRQEADIIFADTSTFGVIALPVPSRNAIAALSLDRQGARLRRFVRLSWQPNRRGKNKDDVGVQSVWTRRQSGGASASL